MTKKKLTIQQERFVEAMAHPRTKSQTEAAIKAGYSPKTAKEMASENLTKPHILDAIYERKQRARAIARITPEEVLGRAVQNMRVSLDDVLNEHGAFDIDKARETGAIDDIKKIKTTARIERETGDCIIRTEIELYSSADARKEVAKYIGLDKEPITPKTFANEEEQARRFFELLVENGMLAERARLVIREKYPFLNLKLPESYE